MVIKSDSRFLPSNYNSKLAQCVKRTRNIKSEVNTHIICSVWNIYYWVLFIKTIKRISENLRCSRALFETISVLVDFGVNDVFKVKLKNEIFFKTIDASICNILEKAKWLSSFFSSMSLTRWIIYIVLYIFKHVRSKLDPTTKNCCIFISILLFKNNQKIN